MTTKNANPVKSIFESIDKRNDNFVNDVLLAKGFTRMVRLHDTSGLPEHVLSVHVTDPSTAKDKQGSTGERYYAIWEEGDEKQLFGAWFFSYKDEDGEIDYDEVVYPQMITTVTRKSHQIVEDIYYMDSIGLPAAWVTYHNAQ